MIMYMKDMEIKYREMDILTETNRNVYFYDQFCPLLFFSHTYLDINSKIMVNPILGLVSLICMVDRKEMTMHATVRSEYVFANKMSQVYVKALLFVFNTYTELSLFSLMQI